MREEPGAMQQSCRTAPHKQQTCVLISFCWTCIWTCYLNMLFAIIVVVLPRPIHYSRKNALKSCQVVKHFSTSKFSSQLRLLISRWMTGIYRRQRQTRRLILQKPSSCEKRSRHSPKQAVQAKPLCAKVWVSRDYWWLLNSLMSLITDVLMFSLKTLIPWILRLIYPKKGGTPLLFILLTLGL